MGLHRQVVVAPLYAPAVSTDPESAGSPRERTTRESQYEVVLTQADANGSQPLGLMSGYAFEDDPKRLTFTFSRYKFVAKMLSDTANVLEVGCGDGLASRIVRQEVGRLVAIDFDPLFIENAVSISSKKWDIDFRVHDFLDDGPLDEIFEGVFCLDVFEHIDVRDEGAFLANVTDVLSHDGVFIVGMPSLASQSHASVQSRAGHVNCKDGPELKSTLERYFSNVFVFSMNDEVVHTGFFPMAQYLFAVCCGPKGHDVRSES